ncbi:MAG: hypothetical protein KKB50_01845 [Planctomycetes bacterium]|nr:hypothetical protein [Planctomycetota bacterium]
MSIMLVMAVVLSGVILCVALAVLASAAVRKRAEADAPRCGNCGYNLTGAPSNRCPECGKLFVEAGVITTPLRPGPSPRAIRLMLIVLVGFTVLGVLGMVAAGLRARGIRARAVAAQQAAVARATAAAARAQAEEDAARPAAIAPGTSDHSPDQPPQNP